VRRRAEERKMAPLDILLKASSLEGFS